jgi:phenylpropionate dioxygenase-like ring-hydroxylating dioxygenase large terminal subunit
MIKDQWYVILRSKELKKGKALGVLRMGERMVLWRDSQGKTVCQADLCPHRFAALSIGCVMGDTIQCPFHGFEYDTSGSCTYVPANGRAAEVPKNLRVQTYPCREAHGYIYIWWGEPRVEYPPLPWFEDLDNTFTTSDFQDHWPVQYSRAIENQLDVFHLAFVHATTIGRGHRTICDGPITTIDEKTLEIWVYNRVDDGSSTAKRPGDLLKPTRPPFLKFQFPHHWMNRISEDMRITVFFTPVDDENTIMYLRYYQRFVRLPLLRQLVAFLINVSSIIILNQDKRVVITQRPKKSGLRIGEKPIPADKPIIEYRSMREKLQKAAGQKVD